MMHPEHRLVRAVCRTWFILKADLVGILRTITRQITSEDLVDSPMWTFKSFHILLKSFVIARVVCDQAVDLFWRESGVGIDVWIWEEGRSSKCSVGFKGEVSTKTMY
jgi:hypothetical protein